MAVTNEIVWVGTDRTGPAFRQVSENLRRTGQVASGQTAPGLDRTEKAFGRASARAISMTGAVLTSTGAFGELGGAVGRVGGTLAGAVSVFSNVSTSMQGATGAARVLAGALGAIGIVGIVASVASLAAGFLSGRDALEKKREATEKYIEAAKRQIDVNEKIFDLEQKVDSATGDLALSIAEFGAGSIEAGRALQQVFRPTDDPEFNRALERGVGARESVKRASDRVAEAEKNLKQEREKTPGDLQAIRDAENEVATSREVLNTVTGIARERGEELQELLARNAGFIRSDLVPALEAQKNALIGTADAQDRLNRSSGARFGGLVPGGTRAEPPPLAGGSGLEGVVASVLANTSITRERRLSTVRSLAGSAARQFSDEQLRSLFPGLQGGGVVPARPGGTLVRVGEGGEEEAVVPLSRLGGGQGLIVVVNMDGQEIARRHARLGFERVGVNFR